MSARTCPDWPQLMELDPGLQFKHYTLAEAKLPAEVLIALRDVALDAELICCDLEHHVFNRAHTTKVFRHAGNSEKRLIRRTSGRADVVGCHNATILPG